MSPSEEQLRAALHEGASGGVDAGVIVAKAERYRRARRQRISYAAAAVVVAAFVGVGGTLLATSGSGDQTAGGSAAGGAAVRNVPSARGASAAPSRASGGLGPAVKVAACPPAPARVVTPGAARRHAGRLFPAGISAITACGYPAGERAVRSVVLTGSRARRVAATLNDGALTAATHAAPCSAADDRIAVLASDADGRRAKPVLVTVHCGHAVATNGAVTRYLATVPLALNRLVR